jgi:hypothetical protein
VDMLFTPETLPVNLKRASWSVIRSWAVSVRVEEAILRLAR